VHPPSTRKGTAGILARAMTSVQEERPASSRALLKRFALIAVAVVSLYLVAPALSAVFASWPDVRDLDPLLLTLIAVAQVGAFGCFWVVLRIALGLRTWPPVITSQLASNAAARVMPGGGAAGNALQYAMLVRSGVPGGTAASGLIAASLLTTGIVLALPALALPAVLGGEPIDRDLARAAWAGAAALVLLGATGAVLLFTERALRWLGRAIQSVRNRLLRRREPLRDLPDRLMDERDFIRSVFSDRWPGALAATLGRWAFDYGSLMIALVATGSRPAPLAVLVAFCSAQALALVPLTPGGLGFVEAGLTGMLVLAGVNSSDALVATLAYRLASYWLPIPFGAVAYVWHRNRYGSAEGPVSARSG
jgi:putative heme transporter